MAKDTSLAPSEKRALLASVALLYYGDGLTQSDIAQRMQLSRATIVNLLREARDQGVVEIRIDGAALTGSSLGQALRAAYGLRDVYLADIRDYGADSPAAALRRLGQVGGIAVTEIVRPGDRVGVAWGATIKAVAEAMPRRAVTDVAVYQMIGSMASGAIPPSETCAIDIANRLDARAFTLHAPALASSAEMAQRMRDEPTIRAQLNALSGLDMVVASLGDMGPETRLLQAGIVTEAELEAARSAGAVGVLCGRFIDSSGAVLRIAPDARLIAADLDVVRRAARRVLVVGGAHNAAAVRAAIAGGFVSHLCVDAALARALLG